MARNLSINMLLFAILALVIGAYGTPPNVTSTAASSAIASSIGTAATAVADVYCPWCTNVTTSAKETDCQLIYQVPENTLRMVDQFVFVFSHNWKYLVQVNMVTSFDPFTIWFLNPAQSLESVDDGLHIVFAPPQMANDTQIPAAENS
ncbi:hypothetical protein B0I37DRAFT_356201 [Chaetomium sp. MPI-CAGE-AT-0009]|nr:hypothetical protein B0I37DRAFT_356201 [Chaetomium sp. MPI-CAGE-AT-0009]